MSYLIAMNNLYSAPDDKPLPDYFGPPLDRPFSLVLNSRQNKMPRGSELWVQKSMEAARYIAEKGHTALTSMGMHPWNLCVWAVSAVGGAQIIVLPKYDGDDFEVTIDNLILDYNLNPDKTGFLLFPTNTSSAKPKAAWRERDQMIIEMADRIYPVAVRPAGNMAGHVESAVAGGKTVIRDFQCEYNPAKPERLHKFDVRTVAEKFPAEKWDYLTHWTHSFTGPWLDETSADYYSAVANSGSAYSRSALASLKRIISEKRIFAGDDHARRGERFVSFTELPPSQAVELMKWKPRQMRYSFEPYGIAIRKEAAVAVGIRKVIYGDGKAYRSLPDFEKPYFQMIGKSDWSREAEWRRLSDVPFEKIDRGDMLIIVAKNDDKARLPMPGGIRVVSLEG